MAAPFGPPWELVRVTPAQPGAGQPLNFTAPVGFHSHLLSIEFVFATSAAVANRGVFVQPLAPGPFGGASSISPVFQTASLTWGYEVSLNFQALDLHTVSEVLMPLPDLVVPEGWVFQISAVNIQAADQLSSIDIFYERLQYV